MIQYIFLFLLMVGRNQQEIDPNEIDFSQNIQELILDDQIQLLQSKNLNLLHSHLLFSYAIYGIQLTSFLENNLFHPKYEIEYLKQYIPAAGEKCLDISDNIIQNYISLFCFHSMQKQVIIHQLGDINFSKTINLNYPDSINLIEMNADSNYFIVLLNIHQSNWQLISFTTFNLNFAQDELIYIVYESESFDENYQLMIKETYMNYQFELLILTQDSRLYRFELDFKESIFILLIQFNQELIDIASTKYGLFLLIKENSICYVNQRLIGNVFENVFTFNCSQNDLQLIVIDSENFYIIENRSTVISLTTRARYQQNLQYLTVMPNFKLVVNYGNSSNIFITLLRQTMNFQIKQIEPDESSFEFDDSFLTQNHRIQFESKFTDTFVFYPFRSGPPFIAKVLEDKYKLIKTTDQPLSTNTCFNSINSFEFVSMITESQFIYQQILNVYYLQCDLDKVMQITLLKRNIRTIQFLSSYMSNNDLYIYFDDSDGLEFFGYKIKNQLQEKELPELQHQQILFSPIQFISESLHGITLNHVDKSKTLIQFEEEASFRYNELPKFNNCDYLIELKIFFLCAQNIISDGVLILIDYQIHILYQVNRYIIKNYLIQDLIVINRDQIVLILKNSISQEIIIYHYQINDHQIFFQREVPSYILKPSKFLQQIQSIFSVQAVDQYGKQFLMVYDVTKSSSKCLIRLLSYDRDIFRLSVKEILVLKLKQEESGMNGFYIQKFQLSYYSLGIQQLLQNQFKQYYSITLQINNLIIQKDIKLNFTGLDFTGQLVQLKTSIPIRLDGKFYKINLNEYIYGPIDQVICLKSCSLHPLIIKKQLHRHSDHNLIKTAIIIGKNLLIYRKKQYYMLNLQNLEIVEFKELNFIKYYNANINYGTFKLVGEYLQELLAVVQYNAQQKCDLTIDVYSIQSQEYINQFEIKDIIQDTCIFQFKRTIIRQNIIIIQGLSQLLVYQYDYISKIFVLIPIQYQSKIIYIYQDHYLSNNYLYFIGGANNNYVILIIDLLQQSIICEQQYQSKTVIISPIILDVSDNKITILYMRQNSYPIIQHISIVENLIASIHIQELVMDQNLYSKIPIYFDKHKIFFSVLFTSVTQTVYFTLQYIVNVQENYTFPSQIDWRIEFLLPRGNNEYIFINDTIIGEISIFNQYEIQVSEGMFEIQVSNGKTVQTMRMNVTQDSNYQVEAQIGVLAISIGILIIYLWSQKTKRRYVKFDNI